MLKGDGIVEDCIWESHHYKMMKGKWKIAIILEAGYGLFDSTISHHQIVCLEHGLYFRSMLLPYPQSCPLLPQELDCFCNGLKIVSKQILQSAPHLPNILITLRLVQFSDCDIQDEAFTAAAIEWASTAFGFEAPRYQVSFDASKGTNGLYVFDFSEE